MSRSVIGSPLTSSAICWARAGDDSAATVAMMRADSPKQLADKTDGHAGRPSPPPKPRFVVFHDLALLGEISRVHAGIAPIVDEYTDQQTVVLAVRNVEGKVAADSREAPGCTMLVRMSERACAPQSRNSLRLRGDR